MKLRFLDYSEFDLLKSTFDFDQRINKVKLTESDIDQFCNKTLSFIKENKRICSIGFDDDDNLIGISIGIRLPDLAGWFQGLNKIRVKPDNYIDSARLMAPIVDHLISQMESEGFYKYWYVAPKSTAIFAREYSSRFSTMMPRYNEYDERIIPKGAISSVKIWDFHRQVNWIEDSIARLYVLKQEHRDQLVDINREFKYKRNV